MLDRSFERDEELLKKGERGSPLVSVVADDDVQAHSHNHFRLRERNHCQLASYTGPNYESEAREQGVQ